MTENNQNWSFIIPTNKNSFTKDHQTIVDSIELQEFGENNFEIIFISDFPEFKAPPPSKTLFLNPIKPNHITRKKNEGAKIAEYENLCIMHDYIRLDIKWFTEFKNFTEEWNVCSSPFINLDGRRMWDWPVINHPTLGHRDISYSTPASEYNYIPGQYFCVKRSFFLENLLDENLMHGQAEDIEWSRRINKKWNYKLNPRSFTKSLKMSQWTSHSRNPYPPNHIF